MSNITIIHNLFVCVFVSLSVCTDSNSSQKSGRIFTKLNGLIRAPHCTCSQKFHSDWVAMGVAFSKHN